MMEKRVVVTGLGAVTPIGHNVESLWKNLLDGVCGIDFIKSFPTDDLPSKVAAEVKDFDPVALGLDLPFVRKQDRFTVFATIAAEQALRMSGLKAAKEGEEGGNIDPFRLGVYMGSGVGGFFQQYNESVKMYTVGAHMVAPTFITKMIANIAGGNIAIRNNACGPNLTVVAACATSTNSVGEAYRAIKHGYADAIVAGGSEAPLIPMGIAAFANARALSRSEDPQYASLPFNANRAGFVMGEGAGALVLEEYEHAKTRGAEIFAEVVGYGHTCDAYHVAAPNPSGLTQAEAIKQCLKEAQYTSNDVLHINAHGTGTSLNDPAETQSYKLALGADAYKAHINSTKSMTGHLLGAAGAVEAIAAILALKEGIIPPTIHLDAPDPACDLDYTPNEARRVELTLALSNSLGFGGHNACIAFRKM
ncbi:MAG: beta-ketoacyl-ACP synthase II [Bacteroidales bacterium]|nr:beta-ketoacyl-ACP synthase II [Bacteroidales bacterium]